MIATGPLQLDMMYYISSESEVQWTLEADSQLLDRNINSFEKA
jgi:hypothetical protein